MISLEGVFPLQQEFFTVCVLLGFAGVKKHSREEWMNQNFMMAIKGLSILTVGIFCN